MTNNFTHILFKLLIFSSFVILQSCQKEDISSSNKYPNVDEELWEYFEKFEAEGRKRGVEIDLIGKGISGEIGATVSSMWAGQCNHNINEPNHLIININFWNSADDLRKEKIIFHELGHCYLGKGHNDAANVDGTCISIMRAGTGACIDNYNDSSKSGYCDELFKM